MLTIAEHEKCGRADIIDTATSCGEIRGKDGGITPPYF